MRKLRQLLQVGLVGLTALAASLAGLPLFHCRCGAGSDHSLALSILPSTTHCTCGGTCCASAEAAAPCCCTPIEAPSCCLGPDTAAPDSLGNPDACMGTLRQADTLAAPPARATAAGDEAVAPLSLPTHALAAFGDGLVPLLFQRMDQAPPPTDRIVVFCHLLI